MRSLITTWTGTVLSMTLAGGALLSACSEDDPLRATGGSAGATVLDGTAPATDADGGTDAGDNAKPVYALTTQVFGESEDQSYVLLTDQLSVDTQLSLKDAVVEIAGRALGTGMAGGRALFIASDLAPTVTRYDLTDEGRLAGGSTLSFLGKGVTSLGEYGGQFQYASDKKAYWFDGPTAQVIVWNPNAMSVIGSLPLTGLAHERETLSFTAAPIWKGDKLYTFAAWREGLTIVPRVAVIVLDTATDQLTIVEDNRCGYARDGVLTPDGKLYLATEAFAAAAHQLNSANPQPCLLRFDTALNSFDATFKLELSSLFEGRAAGTLVTGPENQAFLRVLDPAAVPDGTSNPRVLASVAAWGWATLTPGDVSTVQGIATAPLGGGSVLPFRLGERVFAPLFVDGEQTEFLELTKDGPAATGAIRVPGLVFSAVKLK